MIRILVSAFLVLGAANLCAKELKILTGAGMSLPVRERAAAFGAANGDTVTVVSDTAGGVQKRMEAGEAFDLVIGTSAVLETLAREQFVAVQHHDLARMVAGIGAKAGTDRPAIANGREAKATLLAAKTIAYVDPASGGITGVFSCSKRTGLASARPCAPRRCCSPMAPRGRRGGRRRRAIWRHADQRDAP